MMIDGFRLMLMVLGPAAPYVFIALALTFGAGFVVGSLVW